MSDTTERMSAEDRAVTMTLRTAPVDIACVLASAIEECRRHARESSEQRLTRLRGGHTGLSICCAECRRPWPCKPYRTLATPLLAAGVPEQELRP